MATSQEHQGPATRLLQMLAWALLFALLGACSGSGGSGTPSAAADTNCASGTDCGNVLIAATDAEGDFMSYTVDVRSVTLKRKDGTTVETLPGTTSIDFTELTDLSALLGSASVPTGEYVGGTIVLDYGSADIEVEKNGAAVPAEVFDDGGHQVTGTVSLELDFANDGHLFIARGRTAVLSLDFNLADSNSVDTSQNPPHVTLKQPPSITVSVVPATDRPLRVRGALQSTDTANSAYDVQIRPWHLMQGDHGVVTVHTTDTTRFEINSQQYAGSDGLAALAALPQGTLTLALGSLDVSTHTFTADSVYAGDSVGGVGSDAVYGHVVARSGNSLTVKAGLAVHRDGGAQFARTVMVDIGADTKVFRDGDAGAPLSSADISVGQRIAAFGTFSPTATATTNATAPTNVMLLDATSGRVRLLTTRLDGTVNNIVQGQQIDMNLHDIDHLGIDLFDFSGTGNPDADPTNYSIATSTLTLSGLAVNQAASVLGFVTPFGKAPPDFDARSVVNPGALHSLMSVNWGTAGTTAAFSILQDTGIVLNLDGIGDRHFLWYGFDKIDLTSLTTQPTIVGRTGRGLYGIVTGGHIEMFSDFASFVAGLQQRMTGEAVQSLTAYGAYDASADTFTAGGIIVRTVSAGG